MRIPVISDTHSEIFRIPIPEYCGQSDMLSIPNILNKGILKSLPAAIEFRGYKKTIDLLLKKHA
jgi:hypothetical protein